MLDANRKAMFAGKNKSGLTKEQLGLDTKKQNKKSIIDQDYDDFENNYSRSYVSDSDEEIPSHQIPMYNIHAVATIHLANNWKEIADSGLIVKGKVDFNRLYGFDMWKLKELEREGFIKIKQLSKNPYNIEIESTGKNFKYTRGL
jgi:hypothetical protein